MVYAHAASAVRLVTVPLHHVKIAYIILLSRKETGMTALKWISIILVVIGCLNWGLVGMFKFNLVETVFGMVPVLVRIIYTLVCFALVYLIVQQPKLLRE